MKTMIYSLTLAALMITSFSSCSDDNDPVLTQKDWDGTTTYFASADAMKFDTYYKPSVGYVGDPMPFYDPQAKDFKIMYLQEYRPNQAGTYHPVSYTHLRAHETGRNLVCRLLLEKKKKKTP